MIQEGFLKIDKVGLVCRFAPRTINSLSELGFTVCTLGKLQSRRVVSIGVKGLYGRMHQKSISI